MWSKNYKKVKGIITKSGTKYIPEFEFDFDKLAEMTNHYQDFIDKVKENYEKDKDSFENIVVYVNEEIETLGNRKGEKVVKVFVVFDHHDTYIRLFGCDVNHEKYPYIFEFSQNKMFVSMMADLL